MAAAKLGTTQTSLARGTSFGSGAWTFFLGAQINASCEAIYVLHLSFIRLRHPRLKCAETHLWYPFYIIVDDPWAPKHAPHLNMRLYPVRLLSSLLLYVSINSRPSHQSAPTTWRLSKRSYPFRKDKVSWKCRGSSSVSKVWCPLEQRATVAVHVNDRCR